MKIKACLFDLDGTLVDSMWMWPSIDREYLSKFGIDYVKGIDKDIEGMSFTNTALYFKERFGLKDSIEKIKADWEEMSVYKYTHEVKPKKGAIEFLKDLKAKNIKTGIATSNGRAMVNAVVKSLGLDEYIDYIITSCEVKNSKPAPDIYLKLMDIFEVKPSECLVFEDIPAGIKAGKKAGAITFAMEDEFSKLQKEKKIALSDYFIEDFREVYDYIDI